VGWIAFSSNPCSIGDGNIRAHPLACRSYVSLEPLPVHRHLQRGNGGTWNLRGSQHKRSSEEGEQVGESLVARALFVPWEGLGSVI